MKCSTSTNLAASSLLLLLVLVHVAALAAAGKEPKREASTHLGSLVFVLNTGKSMSNELAALTKRMPDIDKSNKAFANFVIGLYGGALRQPIVQSSTAGASFVQLIRQKQAAAESAECPQPAMTAIAESVMGAKRNSVVIHITDGSASDASVQESAACISNYRNTRVFTVITGDACGKTNNCAYRYVAEKTNGAVIFIDTKFIEQFIEYVIESVIDVTLFDKIATFKPKEKKSCSTRLSCKCGAKRKVQISSKSSVSIGTSKSNVSLGIILDTTGSMEPEHKQILQQVSSLIKSTKKIFQDFVLLEYNDPYEKRMVKTRKTQEALDFLGESFVFAGGDCPEPAFHAIRDATGALSPGSVIFLFTDASVNDQGIRKSVADLLKRKDIVLNVVSTGDMCKSEGKFNRYLEIAAQASGGRQLSMDKNLVKNVLEYIRKVGKHGVELVRQIPETVHEITQVAEKDCKCTKVKECK